MSEMRQDMISKEWVIIPKLVTPAGFEIGTGISINSLKPEDAAAILRDAEPPEIAP